MKTEWLNNFIAEAHNTAVEKGWWESGDRPVDEVHVLIHSEISEAVEHYRSGAMKVFYQPNGKPDGFGIEIADVAIRAADALGRQGHKSRMTDKDVEEVCDRVSRPDPDINIMTLVNGLHDLVCSVCHAYRPPPKNNLLYCEGLETVIWSCWGICKFMDMDFESLVTEKLAYNKTRPYRHGGKKA
jgi:hypothetical protein